ncbi:outer membrane receptor for ferrienterochelin and colicins [Maribacter ulvicola]|uniref:Outer membrane receptor for ferrienterochelin and colicins n=1 Tax=Maribacter ulvicola TaxID=228959 RepID=A0A1N6QTW6_9FLAO|nr:outer membrane receptor for ferrienterochelin and colicins [Maribacter ulvicola]
MYISDYKSKSIEHIFETGELDSEGFLNHNFLRPEFKIYFTPNKNHTAILGFGTTSEKINRDDTGNNSLNAQFVYGQYDATFGKLNVILGARYDNTKDFSSQFSPKLAASYQISNEVKIQGSIGRGFKAPDVRQLFFDWPRSNDHILGYNAVLGAFEQYQNDIAQVFVPASEFTGTLKPERSVSYNLGLTYNPNRRFSADINFFRNNIKDMIVSQVVAVLNDGYRLRASNNVSSAYTQGVEVNTRIKVSNNLRFNLGYQYLDAVDNDALNAFKNGEVTTIVNGEEITLTERDYKGMFDRSKHMFTAKLFYELPQYGLDMNIRASLKSDYGYEDNDTNENGYYDAYDVSINGLGLVDYAINKKLGKSFVLGAGVDNIFDYTDPLNNQFVGGRIFYTKLNYSF